MLWSTPCRRYCAVSCRASSTCAVLLLEPGLLDSVPFPGLLIQSSLRSIHVGCIASHPRVVQLVHASVVGAMLCGVIRKSSSDADDRYELFCDDKGRRIRVSADCWIAGDCSLDLVPAEIQADRAKLRMACSLVDMVGKVHF